MATKKQLLNEIAMNTENIAQQTNQGLNENEIQRLRWENERLKNSTLLTAYW